MKTVLFFSLAGLMIAVLFVSLALGESLDAAFFRSMDFVLVLGVIFVIVTEIRMQVMRQRRKKAMKEAMRHQMALYQKKMRLMAETAKNAELN